MRPILFVLLLCDFLMPSGGLRAAGAMNTVAERYVRLVLALGQHDPDYVDAFYGPADWKTEAEQQKESLDAIGTEAAKLSVTLTETPIAPGSADSNLRQLRREYLHKQLAALAARVRMLKGEKLKFDDESRALYDAVAPTYSDSHFIQIIKQLEAKIPGPSRTGDSLWERYEMWRKPFVIPKEKLDSVFQLAIKECRARRWRTLRFRRTRVSPSST